MRRTSTRWRPFAAVVLAVAAVAMSAMTALAHHSHHAATKVKGTWTNPVGACVGHILSLDPATGDIACTGTSQWKGTWKGATTWTLTGNQNPTTGVGSGRIEEVFTGHAHGRKGTLTFVEHYSLDASRHIDIKGRITDSGGALAGSRGRARWIGTTDVADGSGHGTYSGRWHQGGRGGRRCHARKGPARTPSHGRRVGTS